MHWGWDGMGRDGDGDGGCKRNIPNHLILSVQNFTRTHVRQIISYFHDEIGPTSMIGFRSIFMIGILIYHFLENLLSIF